MLTIRKTPFDIDFDYEMVDDEGTATWAHYRDGRGFRFYDTLTDLEYEIPATEDLIDQ